MKLQNLSVIFIIIIMPIIIVFSEYMNTQISVVKTEEQYDLNLLNSTYDAVKAFQINTVNTMLYTPENRAKNVEAAVNTFYSALVSSFGYDGNDKNIMNEFVPAVAVTLYDGYYIYSPFTNVLTNVAKGAEDVEYEDNSVLNGTKPYVTYSCKYRKNNYIYIIYYTLDNYIYYEKFDSNGKFVEPKEGELREGYLIDGIKIKNENEIEYDHITFKRNEPEVLKEYLKFSINDESSQNGYYYYAVIDGTKYYYEFADKSKSNSIPTSVSDINPNDKIFYIDDNLQKHEQFSSYSNNNMNGFKQYFNAIFKTNSAFQYYYNAYEFTKTIKNELSDLKASDIVDKDEIFGDYEFAEPNALIFDKGYQYSDSNFNRHRADVIRATITTNLAPAITGFSKYSGSNNTEFLMPKISETDWELLENNVCMATFLQGIKDGLGGKTYNNYAVVPNNYNKEFIDENDIYLIKDDNTYTKANDKTLGDNLKQGLGYQPALASINFEIRKLKPLDGGDMDIYFSSMSYGNAAKKNPYLKNYNSIDGTNLGDITTRDMYRFMENDNVDKDNVRKAYYTALARERLGSYKFSNNGIDIKEQYDSTDIIYLNEPDVMWNGNIAERAEYEHVSGTGANANVVFDPFPEKEGYVLAYVTERDSKEIIRTDGIGKEKPQLPDKWYEENLPGKTVYPSTWPFPNDWYDEVYFDAKFIPVEYDIKYDGGYGATGSMDINTHCTYNQIPIKLEDNKFKKTGYSFIGWSTKEGATEAEFPLPNDGEKIFINRNLSKTYGEVKVLYAVWNANTYTATFNGNGGTNGTSITKKYDEPLGTLPTSTRTGYTFDGWYTAANGGTKISSSTTMTIDPTYYAHWTANTYTATFNGNGGSNGTSITKKYDEPLGTLPTSTRTGYTFQGWYTAASGGTKITSATLMTINPTYYAHWTINKYRQIVQVRYQNADGSYGGYSNVINKDYEHFSTVTWSRAQDATYNAASVSYQVTGAKTTQISVTRRTYTVIWNANGGTGGYTGTYRYGQVAWAPATRRDFYTCTGWTANGFAVTGNTSSVAMWRENVLYLYYYRGGGTIQNRGNNVGVNADPCDINPWPISKVSNLRSFLNNDSATLPMKRKGYTATNYWTIGGTKVNQQSVITTYYIATLDGQYEGLRNGDIAVGATPVWKKN